MQAQRNANCQEVYDMTDTFAHPTVGWIGTGVMGRWMCHHILPLASRTFVYNRTMAKVEPLLAEGAIAAASPADVADKADIVFTMVGLPEDVETIYFGENGLFSVPCAGKLFVDMTTTKPILAKRIFEAAHQKGAESLDAPVSGGDRGAREGLLTIMVGGEREAFLRARVFFEAMGKTIVHHGGPGAGQHTKMCNQIAIAGTMIGVCESLLYARKAGLDAFQMVETIRTGAAACWTLDNLAPRILKGDYQPGFYIDHFVKDMGIALEEAKRMFISLPGLALVHQLYIAMQGAQEGSLGTQALVLALDRLNASHQFSFSS